MTKDEGSHIPVTLSPDRASFVPRDRLSTGSEPPRAAEPRTSEGARTKSSPPDSASRGKSRVLDGFVTRLRRLLEPGRDGRKVRGVVGSLEQMSVADIVQILHRGHKSGELHVSSDGNEGTILFEGGAIVHAAFRGLRGEEAFYLLVGLTAGQFSIDPDVAPSERTITNSAEMLLLEGMRRLDEAND